MTPKGKTFPSDKNSGSEIASTPEFLAVGKLRRPHGLNGEVLMSVWTDFPDRLCPGVTIYVGKNHDLYTIHSVRWHREDILVSFEGIENRDDAGIFRNQLMKVRADDRPPLPEGELYQHQLLGMSVIQNNNNALLGKLCEIIETGANDVYLVQSDDGREILLPAIESVIRNVDVEKNEIRVHLLPGLLPDK